MGGPQSNWNVPCERKEGKQTQREKLPEDRGRDRREGAASPGTSGVQEAGKGRKDLILEPLEGSQPSATLISGV